jgi:hypothetical protein
LFPPYKEFEGEKIDVRKNRHILQASFGSVQRISELVQLFEDTFKHLAIRSVWLIEKSKEKQQVSGLAQGLLAGTQSHINCCGQCWCYYDALIGSNKKESISRTVRVRVDSSIQNVEQLESVSVAKQSSAGCL